MHDDEKIDMNLAGSCQKSCRVYHLGMLGDCVRFIHQREQSYNTP